MLLVATLTVGGLLTILFLQPVINMIFIVLHLLSLLLYFDTLTLYTLYTHPKRAPLRLLVKLILKLKKQYKICLPNSKSNLQYYASGVRMCWLEILHIHKSVLKPAKCRQPELPPHQHQHQR